MKDMVQVKRALFNVLERSLKDQINEAKVSVQSLIESRDRDTKSSAGDKHETSRAMAQSELDRAQQQLARLLEEQQTLNRVELERNTSEIGFGSLLSTADAIYFICIGAGKVEHDGQVYYVVSPGSPVGSLLMGKVIGEEISFKGMSIKILAIA